MNVTWFRGIGLSVVLLIWPGWLWAKPVIIDKPITFNAKRIQLTREYRRKHYGIDSKSIQIKPRMIVIHCTSTKTFQQAFNYFNHVKNPGGRRTIKRGGAVNVSAHYMVDRDGSIYRLMPDNWMARHVIGLNPIAIGVENVGCYGGHQDLTSSQLQANAALIAYLVKRYPTIRYLIGHQEYLEYYNTPLWHELDKTYCTVKSDPGRQFMRQLRAKVTALNLKPGVEVRPIYQCRRGGVVRE